MDIWSAGLNWWLTPGFAINFNYCFITLERDGLEGNSHGINTRLVIALQ